MIFGAHVIIYSKDAEADRQFLRDVLDLPSVDAGNDWLICALPPAEMAFHPTQQSEHHELYFMCDDLPSQISALAAKGIRCTAVEEARWGSVSKIDLPGGGQVGLYQPRHALAVPPATS
jgi:hypothetical protein